MTRLYTGARKFTRRKGRSGLAHTGLKVSAPSTYSQEPQRQLASSNRPIHHCRWWATGRNSHTRYYTPTNSHSFGMLLNPFLFLELVPLRARPREWLTTQTLKHTSTQGEKQREAADSENNAENVVTTSSRSVTGNKYYNL